MILVGDRITWSRYPGGREMEGVVVRYEPLWSQWLVRKIRNGCVSSRLTTVRTSQNPRKVGKES